MRRTLFFSLLLASSTFIPTAFAADVEPSHECNGPCLEYSGTVDLLAEWQNPSDDTIGNRFILLPSSETNLRFKANDTFSVMTNIVSEQVEEGDPGENPIFSGLGTYIDQLQVQADFDNLSLWAGKIHPAFGRAWDVTLGLHGTDIAENYELAERLGGGIGYGFEAGGMNHTLQASAFTTDRMILSESLFTNRGRTELADGGAGNTNGVSSFSMALDGCLGAETDSCYDDGDFGYQLAARYQKGGDGSDGNEIGFLGSLNKSFDLGEDAKLRLLGEAAWFKNHDGSEDNALFVTGSGALEMGPMTYSVAYSQQHDFVSGGADTTEHLIDATAMYELGDSFSIAGEKWAVGAGYSFATDGDENVQTVGLKLTSAFDGKMSFVN